jgi:hypothetical protein
MAPETMVAKAHASAFTHNAARAGQGATSTKIIRNQRLERQEKIPSQMLHQPLHS